MVNLLVVKSLTLLRNMHSQNTSDKNMLSFRNYTLSENVCFYFIKIDCVACYYKTSLLGTGVLQWHLLGETGFSFFYIQFE